MIRVIVTPLASIGTFAENLVFLGMAVGTAQRYGWAEFNRALGVWVDAMDKQPQAIFTELSANIVVLLDRILPNCISRFNAMGLTYASIRELADHTRQVQQAQLAGAI